MQVAMTEAFKMKLTIEEADAVFGRPMGIPKTGVFGLYDLIGIDLMADVLESFVKELPESTIEHVRIGGSFVDFSNESKQAHEGSYQLGQLVEHDIFGSGIILALEGRGENLRIQINFEDSGVKWLVSSYAGLKKI